jgi:ABC-type proline/glycine betaine transport system permease subunit
VIRGPIVATIDGFTALLGSMPPPPVLGTVFLAAWQFNGLVSAGLLVVVLGLVGMLGVWAETAQTFALILTAVLLCLLAARRWGMWRNRISRRVVPMHSAASTNSAWRSRRNSARVMRAMGGHPNTPTAG